MNIADSSAWLEYYASADQAEEFVNVIEGEEALVVPAIVVFEVGRRVWQQRGEAAARQAIAAVKQFRVIPLSDSIATQAVSVAMQHGLAMADSVVYATSQALEATLWTQGRDFEGLPGVRYIPKSSG